jgi:hypothetical protein
VNTSKRWASLSVFGAFALVFLTASPAAAKDRTAVEIRVVEATPGMTANPRVDPRLKKLARDFKSLPFQEYTLTDSHKRVMSPGERVSFEFPGPKGEKRFLVVTSHGEQAGGKLRFQLSIRELKFDTLVAVPDGGTILVGGPRHGKKTIFFAVTAKEGIATRGKFDRKRKGR